MSNTPTVGSDVLVVVPRSTNGGQDHAPAKVTRVNPDGTVNLHTFVDVGEDYRITGAKLLPDRATIQKELADLFPLLPGGLVEELPDGTTRNVPGRNSFNGDPWNHSDIAHWVKLAYWPDKPAAPETPEQRAAREAAEAAAAAAAKEARRVRLAAELAALDAE